MRIIPNYNHYNLNPPEPIAYPIEEDPNGISQDVVDEHIYEEEYEAQQLRSYLDFEDAQINELIKHEQSI